MSQLMYWSKICPSKICLSKKRHGIALSRIVTIWPFHFVTVLQILNYTSFSNYIFAFT